MRVLSSKEGSVDDELRLLMSNESCIKRTKRFIPNFTSKAQATTVIYNSYKA